MPARPRSISTTTFRLNETNGYLLRGADFRELVSVEMTSEGFQWVKCRPEKILNDRSVIVVCQPRYKAVPEPLPPNAALLPGDVTITITSACGTKERLRLPVFYQAP